VTERTLNKIAGVTLLETMLALAVGAVVLVGAIIYYASARQSANVTQVIADMNAIVGAYKTYVGRGNVIGNTAQGGSVGISTLQNKGFLPKPFNDPWGQAYVATSCTSVGGGWGGVLEIIIIIPGIGTAENDNTCKAIVQTLSMNSRYAPNSTSCTKGQWTNNCGFQYQFQ
jgi:type II secretory pathway pseudopilin PulG